MKGILYFCTILLSEPFPDAGYEIELWGLDAPWPYAGIVVELENKDDLSILCDRNMQAYILTEEMQKELEL